MICQDLYHTILLEPIQLGANRLHIVSGYATSAMAFHHLSSVLADDFDIYMD